MLVKDLISYLKQFTPDAEVVVNESTDSIGAEAGYEVTDLLQTKTKLGVTEVHILY